METKGGGHVGRNLVNGEQLEKTDAPAVTRTDAPPSAALSRLSRLLFSLFRGFHPSFVTFFLKVLD